MKWLSLFAVLFCVPYSAGAATLYVINNGTNSTYVVDTVAMSGTLLGAAGVNINFGGIAFSADGSLYGYSTANDYNDSASLYSIDMTSGAWTLIGESGVSGGESIDVDPTSGKAYAPGLIEDGLQEIDLSTGLATYVSSVPHYYFSASAFSPDGTLYISNDTGEDVQRPLFALDIPTGAATFLGILDLPGDIATSLAFNPDDGFLYSVGLHTPNLWKIDPSDASAENLGVISGLPMRSQYTGATIRIATIPVPAVIWLFPAGLIVGLSWMRRQSNNP